MIELRNGNLRSIRSSTRLPDYDRTNIRPGIVHIGVGNFHRVHQATAIEECLHASGHEHWAICGVGLTNSSSGRKKAASYRLQDNLYTVNDRTVFNSELPFVFIGNQTFYGVPLLTVIAFSVIIVSWFVLKRTVLGVRIYALGGNADASRLAGIKVPLILMFVYGMSGLLAGLGGAMSAARLFAANGVQLGQSYELDAIAAVILGGTSFVGGTGSIWGTLVGALIIAVLSNGLILTGVSDIWQYIIKGLVIIGAVALDRYRLVKAARS